MTAAETPCDLCSLPVGVKPFSLNDGGRMRHFCCEGCRGIYQMLHDIKESTPYPGQNAKNLPEGS